MIACHSGSAKKASWGRTSYEQQHQSTRDNQSGRVMDVYKHRRRRRTLRSVVMTNGVYFSSVRMLTTPNQHHQARPKQNLQGVDAGPECTGKHGGAAIGIRRNEAARSKQAIGTRGTGTVPEAAEAGNPTQRSSRCPRHGCSPVVDATRCEHGAQSLSERGSNLTRAG